MIEIMMIVVVSAGDGCRGFEDVIMDEVKNLKKIFFIIIAKVLVKIMVKIFPH